MGGNLVPDSIMVGLITEQLRANKWLNARSSWLLDGFPRTLLQAEKLDKVLYQQSAPLNLVVELDVNQSVILERVEARWIHLPSGRVYNLDYNPPKVAFKDDITGEPLLKRSDDTAEVFQKRLDSYNEEISPLREYYKEQGILATASGDSSDIIFPKLKNLVETRFA
ncbi:P-loop containing nucleoside triphosphate hydrolase protein [Metschnikowia bicuspidata var. bicuspidata NRRL YB-4993]|uniref:p-loop containing nucleoside triphosphate hydrolase protein n=1 Tax=Metschnikowia bicuspidata var. bicuspidata NRRL YB-4993 TaxID=869754 RepID=A0A1A0HL58_9ASCO|nr:P-loop containing nucleoside triphosphate hydrolase protein [Metschnikowia bicuspidata var. bicuspidata NRRL YB-4993]OBA24548.1 P-loop containing nucleoside triphosphate hydrolase protein [Metschnikowia bicuspidata var. bicuspidata NRRL YB-4993]